MKSHLMWDSTQLKFSGAIVGMTAAASAKPSKPNRQTIFKWVGRSDEYAYQERAIKSDIGSSVHRTDLSSPSPASGL